MGIKSDISEDEIIVISDTDEGDMFYGNEKQFKECYFTNTSKDVIIQWAVKNGLHVEFREPQ